MSWIQTLFSPTLMVHKRNPDGSLSSTELEEKRTEDVLAGKKHIVLYFSASWCTTCDAFAKDMREAYAHASDDTEVVLITLYETEASYATYSAQFPWPSVPFKADSADNMRLAERFAVTEVPRVILLDGELGFVDKDDMRAEIVAKKRIEVTI